MEELSCNIFNSYDMNFGDVELIRAQSFGVEYVSDYYRKLLYEQKLLVLIAKINKRIIGGCYISDEESSMYIEQLFVLNTFKKMNIESKLIDYAIKNKNKFVKYFDTDTEYIKVTPTNEDSEELYKSLGFRKSRSNINGTMIKRI